MSSSMNSTSLTPRSLRHSSSKPLGESGPKGYKKSRPPMGRDHFPWYHPIWPCAHSFRVRTHTPALDNGRHTRPRLLGRQVRSGGSSGRIFSRRTAPGHTNPGLSGRQRRRTRSRQRHMYSRWLILREPIGARKAVLHQPIVFWDRGAVSRKSSGRYSWAGSQGGPSACQ